MSDDSKRLAIEGPKALALRATFVNGSVVVESQKDRAKRRAKKKRSRWDNQGPTTSGESSSNALVPLGTDISERKKYTYVGWLKAHMYLNCITTFQRCTSTSLNDKYRQQ